MADNTENPAPTRHLRAWQVLLAIFIILILTWIVYYMHARTNFEAACEKVRAAGYPVTLAELNDWYKLPEGEQNAADEILDAIDLLVEWNREKARPLPIIGKKTLELNEPYDPDTLQLAEEYLAENAPAIKLLGDTAKIKHARYPVDLINPYGSFPAYPGDIKRAVQTLTIDAHIYAEKNQPDKAVDTIETMAAVSLSLAEEPTLRSQLFMIDCDALTIAAVERVVSRCDLADSQLNRLAEIIASMQANSSITTGLIGIRCLMASATANGSVATFLSGRPCLSLRYEAMKISGLAYQNGVAHIDLLTELIDAFKLPLKDRLTTAEAIDRKTQAMGPLYYFAQMTLPATVRIVKVDLKNATNLRVAQTAIAAQRWRLKHGQLPENLNQLVPGYLEDAPIDPYDGKPLCCKKSNDGFTIYSIAENKIDEGGTKGWYMNGDIPFEIKYKTR